MKLRTLGELALEGIAFRRPKPLLLLAYLALEGPKSRRQLAELFWPVSVDARDILSTTVRRLNGAGKELVRVNGRRLVASVDCDALAFEESARRKPGRTALEMYGGPFLDGLDLSLGEEIEEWVYATRERLADLARSTHLTVARTAMAAGLASEVARHAELALDMPHTAPIEQADLDELLGLLRSGQSPRVQELMRLASDPERELPSGAVQLARVHHPGNLPAAGTSFVGRDAELATITDFLEADVRLLTLHGPGGVGKSRLALEAARRYSEGANSVANTCWVPLEDVQEPADVASAIAETMKVPLTPGVPEEQQVINLLQNRLLLLVLDNFEHLCDRCSLPSRILRECPEVRLLVTSRQLLNLSEEHVLPLTGLPITDQGSVAAAITLLYERLEQGGAGGPLTPEDELAAYQICRLVRGLPLAIELAASWGRVLRLPEIAQELQQGLDFLMNLDNSAPSRRQSLRATFQISWRLLDSEEQAAMRRLSVFKGGFSRSAAKAVAGASLRLLAGLVDKSLLWLGNGGRFERHPLVKAYAAEKLAEQPDEAAHYRAVHAEYFLELANRKGDSGLGGPDVKGSWRWFSEEFLNLKAAWSHAASQPEKYLALLLDVCWYTSHYAEQSARFREVRGLYRAVPLEGNQQLEGEVVCATSWLSQRLGELPVAEAEAWRGLRLLEPFEPAQVFRGRWCAHETLFLVGLNRGDSGMASGQIGLAMKSARQALENPLPASHHKSAEIALAVSQTAAGWVEIFTGDFEEARTLGATAHELLERHQSGGLVYALSLNGQAALCTGDARTAKSTLQQALAHARLVGQEGQETQILRDLAHAQLALGELDAAESTCQSGLQLTDRNGNRWHETILLGTLGRVLLAAGRPADALATFARSARTGLAAGIAAHAFDALLGFAEHRALQGRRDSATSILVSIVEDAKIPAPAKTEAAEMLDGLTADLASDARDLRGESARVEFWLEELASAGDYEHSAY